MRETREQLEPSQFVHLHLQVFLYIARPDDACRAAKARVLQRPTDALLGELSRVGHARCICRSLYASRGPGVQCSSGRSKPHDLGAGGPNLNRLAGQINDPDMAAFRSQEQEGALALPLLYWYRYVCALCLHPETPPPPPPVLTGRVSSLLPY